MLPLPLHLMQQVHLKLLLPVSTAVAAVRGMAADAACIASCCKSLLVVAAGGGGAGKELWIVIPHSHLTKLFQIKN